ncbi:VanZ like family protein [Stieleria neptunia]|uniref:VanZ like family protein n=2 Tax=Stieleria neptunia TaxID=2527979 RepID=A0A518HQY4_9BACT|nr:VanZ like family protein [Stieleria neptunia]
MLGLLAIAMLSLAIYGSFLPMRYVPTSWAEATAEFKSLPWFHLGIYRRADWVANGLIILLPSFLMSGAIDWGRSTRWPLMLFSPLVVVVCCAVAVAIEYCQAFFPIRTQSLNDLSAGCVGALLGPLVYLVLGRPFASAVFKLRDAEWSQKLRWLIVVFVFLNLAYAVMPLDLMLQPSDYVTKYHAGRIILLPSMNGLDSPDLMMVLFLSLIRGAILAAMFSVCCGTRTAVLGTIAFALTNEVLQIPVFTRFASAWEVIAATAGIPVGIAGARLVGKTKFLTHAWFWISAGGLALVLITVGTLGRSTGWVESAEAVQTAWGHFWDWPLAKYYFTSEFEAGSNVVAKLGLFAIVGFCFAVGVSKLTGAWRTVAIVWVAIAVVVTATFIEVMQVYLKPHIADASDILLYLTGAMAGWLAYQFVFGLETVGAERGWQNDGVAGAPG